MLTRPTLRPFVGLKNYWDLVRSTGDFWIPLINTLYFVSVTVSIQLILGFIIALALNRVPKGAHIFRTCLIVPMAVTPAVVGLIWKFMLGDFGIVNYLLGRIGLGAQNWLGEISKAMLVVIGIDVWQWTPLVTLILSAGLKNLPKEPVEAAEIDGATKLQVLRYVTIPLLKPLILVALLIRVMEALKIFDMLWVLTFGGPGTSTETLSIHIYRIGFRFLEMGRACALSYILLVITVLIAVFLTRILFKKKKVQTFNSV